MPIPPNLAKALSYTTNGIPYATCLDGYSMKGSATARELGMNVIIGEETTEEFLKAAVGYTTWDGSNVNLQRNLPIQSADGSFLWCDDYELVKKGVIGPNGEGVGLLNTGEIDPKPNLANAFAGNWPTWDWSMYRLTFLRPQWWILSDATLASLSQSYEQFRYVQFGMRYVPKEKKQPNYGFEYDKAAAFSVGTPSLVAAWSPGTPQAIAEVGFRPDYQIEFILTWKQVPLAAYPGGSIAKALLTVNESAFQLGNTSFPWPAGTLLFKGPANPISWYLGSDGKFYQDIQYVIAFQPGGWNNYMLNSLSATGTRQYAPIRARNVTPNTPPYPATNFQKLFTAGPG